MCMCSTVALPDLQFHWPKQAFQYQPSFVFRPIGLLFLLNHLLFRPPITDHWRLSYCASRSQVQSFPIILVAVVHFQDLTHTGISLDFEQCRPSYHGFVKLIYQFLKLGIRSDLWLHTLTGPGHTILPRSTLLVLQDLSLTIKYMGCCCCFCCLPFKPQGLLDHPNMQSRVVYSDPPAAKSWITGSCANYT